MNIIINNVQRLICILGVCMAATICLGEIKPEWKLARSKQAFVSAEVESVKQHLVAAIQLATEREKSGSLRTFFQKLTALGIGKVPVDPPWIDVIHEGHRKEVMGRIKMLGQEDIKAIKALDLDRDQVLTSSEISHALTQYLVSEIDSMLKVDGNNDQKLSLTEYALVVPARGEERDEDGVDWHQRGHFEEDDSNKDGFVDASEILSRSVDGPHKRAMLLHFAVRLERMDSNQDGRLLLSEFMQLSPTAKSYWHGLVSSSTHIELKSVIPRLYWVKPEVLEAILAPQ